jgi:hypothetical protein
MPKHIRSNRNNRENQMRDFSKLPIIVVDDDFFEYVAEMGHSDEITYEDYVLLCQEWLADNT